MTSFFMLCFIVVQAHSRKNCGISQRCQRNVQSRASTCHLAASPSTSSYFLPLSIPPPATKQPPQIQLGWNEHCKLPQVQRPGQTRIFVFSLKGPHVKEYIKITAVTNSTGCTATTENISLDAAASRKSANAPSTSEVLGLCSIEIHE